MAILRAVPIQECAGRTKGLVYKWARGKPRHGGLSEGGPAALLTHNGVLIEMHPQLAEWRQTENTTATDARPDEFLFLFFPAEIKLLGVSSLRLNSFKSEPRGN